MAKQFALGVDGVARKVSRAYVSVLDMDSMYETRYGDNINITTSNIEQYFTVSNGMYYFVGNGGTFTTNNGGIKSSTASTTLTALKDFQVSFNYSYSSEKSYDKFYLTVGESVVEDAASGTTTNKSWTGTIKAGQTISFRYTKDNSQDTNDDKCTFSNMAVAETYRVPVENFEVKPVARNIIKGYIGDSNGVARLFFQLATRVKHVDSTPALGYQRRLMGATSVKNYAIFAGGCSSTSTVDNTTFAFDSSRVRTLPTVLSTARFNMFASTVGGKALFGGGQTSTSASSVSNVVETFDNNLTKGTTTAMRVARRQGGATTVGSYALFGGGETSSSVSGVVDAYNSSMTRIDTVSPLSVARSWIGAATIGNYAIFVAGLDSNTMSTTTCDFYDKSLTKISNLPSSPNGYFTTRYGMVGASTKNHAVFVGGDLTDETYGSWNDGIAYDSSLTSIRLDFENYPDNIGLYATAVTLGDNAIFSGSSTAGSTDVTAYDAFLIKYNPGTLNTARTHIAACSVGNYALFVGGVLLSGNTSQHIDSYELV